MKLDLRFDSLGRIDILGFEGQPIQGACVEFPDGPADPDVLWLLRLKQILAALEAGGIKIRRSFPDVVSVSLMHGELDAIMGHVGHGKSVSGHGDAGQVPAVVSLGFLLAGRRQVRHEDVPPAKEPPLRNHVAHIQNGVGELLIENVRLHFGGELRGGHAIQCEVGLIPRPRR